MGKENKKLEDRKLRKRITKSRAAFGNLAGTKNQQFARTANQISVEYRGISNPWQGGGAVRRAFTGEGRGGGA